MEHFNKLQLPFKAKTKISNICKIERSRLVYLTRYMVFKNKVLMFYRFYELCRSVFFWPLWCCFITSVSSPKPKYKIKYKDRKKIM